MGLPRFLKLFLNFFISQIAFVVIVSTDLIFLSKAGISGLAGAGLAALIYSSIYMFFHGFAVCYSNISATEIRQGKKIHNFYDISLKLSSLSVICYLILFPLFKQVSLYILSSVSEQHYFNNYLFFMGGTLPLQLFFNLKRYKLASFETHKLPSLVFLFVAFLNLFLNYGLIRMFLPLGWMLVNAVAAASILSWLIGIFLLEMGSAHLRTPTGLRPTRLPLKSLLVRGSFLGSAYLIESLYFSVIAAVVGRYGTFALAASNAANSILYIAFMVPVSVSNSLSIILSKDKDTNAIKDTAKWTTGISIVGITILSGVCFFPACFLGIYYGPENNDFPMVLAAYEKISILILAFHICDCFQNISSGILRAHAYEHLITRNLIIGLWCCGVPCMFIADIKNGDFHWIWSAAVIGMLIVTILHVSTIFKHAKGIRRRSTP